MVLTIIVSKLKSLILLFVSLFRRALCCFRRRRRYSCEVEPLTDIGVVSNEINSNETETWGDWGGTNFASNRTPNSIQEHIEFYRQQKALQQAKELSEQEQTDFFENMAPKITKQKKILINLGGETSEPSKNLLLVPDSSLVTKELGEWEENSGWEGETLDCDAQQILMEKKRQERERRAFEQHQRRLERTVRPLNSASKVVT